MANTREIQSRIRSVRDTMKITNAMYMISSTKLRKARKNLDSTKEYFHALQEMVFRIREHSPDIRSRFFEDRPEKKKEERTRGILIVTADKGLAGAYNHNVLKKVREMLQEETRTRLYVVGEVGRHYFDEKRQNVEEHFEFSAQNPSLHRARVISERLMEQYLSGELDEVFLVYTELKNSMASETRTIQLLPFSMGGHGAEHASVGDELAEDEKITEQEPLIFKPDPEHVLDNIIPDCIMGYVYGALVESFCSEQNSRMLAMETANNNAKEMIEALSIEFNRARQAMITQEITEVIAGVRAQKKKKQEFYSGGCDEQLRQDRAGHGTCGGR